MKFNHFYLHFSTIFKEIYLIFFLPINSTGEIVLMIKIQDILSFYFKIIQKVCVYKLGKPPCAKDG